MIGRFFIELLGKGLASGLFYLVLIFTILVGLPWAWINLLGFTCH